MTKPTGYIIYRGPSLIDGAPIVAVALTGKSRNSKTGAMMQTYIIREDKSPIEAVRDGTDYSICGNCRHRGTEGRERSCYVTLAHGPRAVYAKLSEGGYPMATTHEAIATLGAGRIVRLGTYGDPAAVPAHVWESLVSRAESHTGYTHQWANPRLSVKQRERIAKLCMASADSIAEREAANSLGYRTFRVVPVGERPAKREAVCPASAEAGKKLTCAQCRACGGANGRRGDIVIQAHGAGAKYVA